MGRVINAVFSVGGETDKGKKKNRVLGKRLKSGEF